MSRAPTGMAYPLRSSTRRRRRDASGAPRDWIPTRATLSSSSVRSMISCAIRERAFAIASSSRRSLAVASAGTCVVKTTPFRPRWTGLKDWLGESTARVRGRPAGARTRAHELGLAAFRERDRHEVEVAWDDRRRKELRRLVDDLVREVPSGHVR